MPTRLLPQAEWQVGRPARLSRIDDGRRGSLLAHVGILMVF